MASNEKLNQEYVIPETYEDQTPAENLDKKTLNKMVRRSLFLQGSFNFERMQSAGRLYGILPGLEKIHKNKRDLAASMSHNLEFFNTHPFLVTFVMGIILSLEQHKTDIPTTRAVRVAAMGPLGGIGDALFRFTLVPITAGITSNMAIDGSLAAPIIFLLVFNIFQFAVRFGLMNRSYRLGQDAIGLLTENAKEFTRAASLLGIFIVGALTANYGSTSVAINIPNGQTAAASPVTTVVTEEGLEHFAPLLYAQDENGNYVAEGGAAATKKEDRVLKDGAEVFALANGDYRITYNETVMNDVTINIQQILDGILPKMIPLALTLLLYFMMTRHGRTPIKCILLLLGIAFAGYLVELLVNNVFHATRFKFRP